MLCAIDYGVMAGSSAALLLWRQPSLAGDLYAPVRVDAIDPPDLNHIEARGGTLTLTARPARDETDRVDPVDSITHMV
jgi:hypothetical protein